MQVHTHISAKGSGTVLHSHRPLPPPWTNVSPCTLALALRHQFSGKGYSHNKPPADHLKGHPPQGWCMEWGQSQGSLLPSKLFPQRRRQEAETPHAIPASSHSVNASAWAVRAGPSPKRQDESTPDGHVHQRPQRSSCRAPPALGSTEPLLPPRACLESKGLLSGSSSPRGSAQAPKTVAL